MSKPPQRKVVDARRQVVTRRRHRPDVAHRQPVRAQVAGPADRVERIVRVAERRPLPPPAHPQPPTPVGVGRPIGRRLAVRLRRDQHPRVDDCVPAHQPEVGPADGRGRLDHEQEGRLGGDEAVRRPPRQHEVLLLGELQRPVVGLQHAGALVDVDDLVGVAVAVGERHGRRQPAHRHPQVVVGQRLAAPALRVLGVTRGQLVEVEGQGAERAVDIDPGGGRLRAVEVAHRPGERLPAVLLLDQARWDPDVRLAGDAALHMRHGADRTPGRRACTGSGVAPRSVGGPT
ncbi:hypothetical protein BH24ACT10_BH24ACT10_17740 [soil metagenome]